MEIKVGFQEAPRAPPRQAMAMGILCIAMGLVVAACALGVIPTSAAAFHAPREVVFDAGLMFAVAGVLLVANGSLPAWLGKMLGAVIWTLFAVTLSWIAWGAGPRNFSGDGQWLLAVLGLDFESVGRTMFGLVALLLWFCTFAVWGACLSALAPLPRVASALGLIAVAVWFLWARHLEPRFVAGENESDRLIRYIDLKHADPDFEASEENTFLQPRAEPWIKLSRARLAAGRVAPPGASVRVIPQVATAPTIDGRIDPTEWQDALRLPLDPFSRHAQAMLMTHGGKLYIAAEAPRDATAPGFDQMRFYFHLDLSPAFEDERVFVSRGSGDVVAMRSVRTPQMRYGENEEGVLAAMRGESTLAPHRQFELELDLDEAGLAAGAPFPFFIEVEGDPLKNERGKFKSRLIEGEVGSRRAPVWARIAARN